MNNLSDVQLRKLVKAKQAIAGLSDGGGLTFTLSKPAKSGDVGTAAWVLRYRTGKKRRELTLGRYPDLSLADARKKAAKERTRIADGVDPAGEKRRAKLSKASARSFRELAEDYMVRVAPSLAKSTCDETRRYLDKDILPRIGGLAIQDVTPAEIVHLVETVASRTQSVARCTFEFVSTIFAHGVAKHLAPANPCASLKISAIIGQKTRRSRLKLFTQELETLLTKLPLTTPENALSVRLLLITAVRKSELTKARWQELDLDSGAWTIPAERIKGKKSKERPAFTIPLPPQAIAYFRSLKQLAGGSQWVLPRRAARKGRTGGHISASTINGALDRLDIDVRRFTPHDLRSTARSYLTSELGVSVVVAERALNHALGGLVGVYDQSDYIIERRRALEMWAAYLDDVEAGRKAKVTPLRSGAAA